jgi:hypothetical protein
MCSLPLYFDGNLIRPEQDLKIRDNEPEAWVAFGLEED